MITEKHLWWSLFSIKLQVWIIKSSFNSLVWLVFILEIIPKAIWNCIIVNPLIRKHVRHLNEDIIYYNFSFFIEKSYWNLSNLLHNLVYHIWIHFYSGNFIVKSKLLPPSGTSLGAIESHPWKGAIKFFFLSLKHVLCLPEKSQWLFLTTLFLTNFQC